MMTSFAWFIFPIDDRPPWCADGKAPAANRAGGAVPAAPIYAAAIGSLRRRAEPGRNAQRRLHNLWLRGSYARYADQEPQACELWPHKPGAKIPLSNNVSRLPAPLLTMGCPQRISGASVPARLDAIDQQILKELQEDGRITNVELARRVGISAPPCLRRLRALERAGYIKGYRALLDEKLLGYEVTVFAMVHLTSQAEADLKAFEDFVRAQPLVRECWMLSGEIDFVLKCVAPDLKTFQAFVAELTAAPHVRNVKTSLTLHNSKDAAMVPMDRKPRA